MIAEGLLGKINKNILIIVLLIFLLAAGCQPKKGYIPKKKPKEVVKDFIRLVQENKVKQAVDIYYDFNTKLKYSYQVRESKKQEYKIWQIIRKRWKENNFKPDFRISTGSKRNEILAYVQLPIQKKDRNLFPKGVIVLDLFKIKDRWKIVAIVPIA